MSLARFDVNPNQLHILQHSLGCDDYGQTEYRGRETYYRNRYICDPEPALIELCNLGLMEDHGAYEIVGGMHCYCVTPAGIAVMKAESPAPPKVSRSRQRYRDYLRADSSWSFGEWLRYGGYKLA